MKVEHESVTLMGNRFEGKDLGFATVFPNPLAEDRLILWVAGISEQGIENLSKTGFRWPDYLIVDDLLGSTGKSEDVLCAGFYDRAWRYSEDDCYKRNPANVSAAVGAETAPH